MWHISFQRSHVLLLGPQCVGSSLKTQLCHLIFTDYTMVDARSHDMASCMCHVVGDIFLFGGLTFYYSDPSMCGLALTHHSIIWSSLIMPWLILDHMIWQPLWAILKETLIFTLKQFRLKVYYECNYFSFKGSLYTLGVSLPIDLRIKYFEGIQVYNILDGSCPEYLKGLLN